MWRINGQGEKEFRGGKDDWPGAAHEAAHCFSFHPDVEEEQIADEAISCYNCRYRRWTAASFACNGNGMS
jgi:hypothetical protein